MPLVYNELRALAQHFLQQERSGHSLQATSLVHEAYLRLIEQKEAHIRDRAHFFAIAAQAIRRILVDHARARNAVKRGGRKVQVTLNDAVAAETGYGERAGPGLDLAELNEALEELAALSPRQAQIVEMRFFGGLSVDEVADVLGVSPRTVDGDWAMARAWLRNALDGGRQNRPRRGSP